MRRACVTWARSWRSKAASAPRFGAPSNRKATSFVTAAAKWVATRPSVSIPEQASYSADPISARMALRSAGRTGETMRKMICIAIVAISVGCGKSEAQKQAEEAADNLKKAADAV